MPKVDPDKLGRVLRSEAAQGTEQLAKQMNQKCADFSRSGVLNSSRAIIVLRELCVDASVQISDRLAKTLVDACDGHGTDQIDLFNTIADECARTLVETFSRFTRRNTIQNKAFLEGCAPAEVLQAVRNNFSISGDKIELGLFKEKALVEKNSITISGNTGSVVQVALDAGENRNRIEKWDQSGFVEAIEAIKAQLLEQPLEPDLRQELADEISLIEGAAKVEPVQIGPIRRRLGWMKEKVEKVSIGAAGNVLGQMILTAIDLLPK